MNTSKPITYGMFNKLATLFASPRQDFVAPLLNFYSRPQDNFVMVVATGHAHILAIIILYPDSILPKEPGPDSYRDFLDACVG
jgi:hypothetical protein